MQNKWKHTLWCQFIKHWIILTIQVHFTIKYLFLFSPYIVVAPFETGLRDQCKRVKVLSMIIASFKAWLVFNFYFFIYYQFLGMKAKTSLKGGLYKTLVKLKVNEVRTITLSVDWIIKFVSLRTLLISRIISSESSKIIGCLHYAINI